MLRWAIAFLFATLISAAYAFGFVATTYAGIAQIVFSVFLGLFVLTLMLWLFFRHGLTAGGAAWFGGLVLIAGLAGYGVHAWVDNGLTAERIGRQIDEGAFDFAENAGQAFASAADQIKTSTTDLRQTHDPSDPQTQDN